jgi:predicted RNase H-like HicB family nuclease
MAKRKIYTVSKRKKGGWQVKESSLGVFAKGDTKEEVLQAATSVARLQKKATLRIEKEDGELQEERTYPRGEAPVTSSDVL